MKQLLAIFAVLVLASGTAFAGGAKFGDVDANKDGAVSIEEATSAGLSEDKAKAADANGDGQLDVVEFSALETAE
jgi:hypothetical protein